MSFWGVEVKPGMPVCQPWKWSKTNYVRITQATLGVGDGTGRSVVKCCVGTKTPVFICSLLPYTNESYNLNLKFEVSEDVMFSVSGPQSVHLSGYYITHNQHPHLSADTDLNGINIEYTDTESSYHSSEDKYEQDSFIDDTELSSHSPTLYHPEKQVKNKNKVIEPVDYLKMGTIDDDDYLLSNSTSTKRIEYMETLIGGNSEDDTHGRLAYKEKHHLQRDSCHHLLGSIAVIEQLAKGTDPHGEVALHGREVKVHFIAKLMDNDYVFESTIGRPPCKFRLGDQQVISGLNAGVEGMRVGDKRRLIIPPYMGYGEEGCDEKSVPPNSSLVYEVELISVRS